MAVIKGMDRREFMVTTLTVGGGFALALTFPRIRVEAAAKVAKIPDKPWESLVGKGETEINPWLVVAPDDTVTIRVAQSEMGKRHLLPVRRWFAKSLNATGPRCARNTRPLIATSARIKFTDAWQPMRVAGFA